MSKFRLSADFLPDNIVKEFTALDHRVARYMCRVFMIRKEVITLDYCSISPTEATVAKACGATVSAISRSLGRLYKQGVFNITRTRKMDGTYHINRYTIGTSFKKIFSTFKNLIKGIKSIHLREQTTVLNSEEPEENYYNHFAKMTKNIGGGGMRPAPS